MLPQITANRHAVDQHENIAPQPVVTALDISAQARDDWTLPQVAANRHAVNWHEDVAQP